MMVVQTFLDDDKPLKKWVKLGNQLIENWCLKGLCKTTWLREVMLF